MIDDDDVSVRTTADILLNDLKKSRKAKDWEASEASRRILDDHEYYHHWHATERAFVAAQQGPSHVRSQKIVESDLVSIESDRTKSASQVLPSYNMQKPCVLTVSCLFKCIIDRHHIPTC